MKYKIISFKLKPVNGKNWFQHVLEIWDRSKKIGCTITCQKNLLIGGVIENIILDIPNQKYYEHKKLVAFWYFNSQHNCVVIIKFL